MTHPPKTPVLGGTPTNLAKPAQRPNAMTDRIGLDALASPAMSALHETSNPRLKIRPLG